jgi:hypothetical protein
MKYLTREELLNSKDITEEDMDCPLWGGKIKIKSINLEQRTIMRLAATKADGSFDDKKFAIATFIEGVSEPKFTAADYDALNKKGYATMHKILDRICEISGIGVDAKNVSKATEKEKQ